MRTDSSNSRIGDMDVDPATAASAAALLFGAAGFTPGCRSKEIPPLVDGD